MVPTGACVFEPCPWPVALTLRLIVDGCDLSVPTCDHHALWVRCFAEEDDAVRLVDELWAPSEPESEDSA
jgi:hypothetical protein